MINNENILSHKDYTGGCIYHEDGLEQILTPEGVVVPKEGGGFQYQYFLKDHLGNVRVVFTKDETTGEALVLQENHYYPFGMKFLGDTFENSSNKFLYNGNSNR